MAYTEKEISPNPEYRHGSVLSLQKVTDFIVSQKPSETGRVKLFTLSYDLPPDESNAGRIHNHLRFLANNDVDVTVGIENTYGNRVAPKSDLPVFIAKYRGERAVLQRVQDTQQELRDAGITVVFNGSEDPPLLPWAKIDHRKLLLIYGKDKKPKSAVIFGASVNYHFDPQESMGSALYLSDPEVLTWLDEYSQTPHITHPKQLVTDSMTLTTRELTKDGNELADKEIINAINSAQGDILFSAQWIPDGKTFKALAKAARNNRTISIYSNFPSVGREPLYAGFRRKALHDLAKLQKETGNVEFFAPKPPLFDHVNALIIDRHNPDITQVLTGTDNMTNKLIQRLRTRETLITLHDQKMKADFVGHVNRTLIPNCRKIYLENATWRNILREALPGKADPLRARRR
jgi:hypothetical protein